MNSIEEKIRTKLSEVEAQRGCRILFAVESGSRAWGFASADSDYDVRFVYAWSADRYLAVSAVPENIEAGIDEDAIDLSGWEFRKALRLFRKSNGALCEWIRSPIFYRRNAAVMEEWDRLLDEIFDPKANAIHYLGLARQMWHRIREEEKVTAKRYLYALRAALSARFVINMGSPAPVPFSELLAQVDVPAEVRSAIARMIAEKSEGREVDGIAREPDIESFLTSELETLSGMADGLEGPVIDDTRLDTFFRKTLSDR
jgi:predicted nucleotidyltransferase